MTTKKTLKRIIDVAAGREKADLAIINANVVDVFNHSIIKNAAVLVANGVIAGVRTEGELCADQIIDMGPEGGQGGGTVICTGTPEKVAACKESYTGQYLKPMLEKGGDHGKSNCS